MASFISKVYRGTLGTRRYVPVPSDWAVGDSVLVVTEASLVAPSKAEPEPEGTFYPISDRNIFGKYYKVDDGLYEKIYSVERTSDGWYIRTHNAANLRIFVAHAYDKIPPNVLVYDFVPANLKRN